MEGEEESKDVINVRIAQLEREEQLVPIAR